MPSDQGRHAGGRWTDPANRNRTQLLIITTKSSNHPNHKASTTRPSVAPEDDVDEGMDFTLHYRMSDIGTMIKEDEDWGLGVEGLMREWGGTPSITSAHEAYDLG